MAQIATTTTTTPSVLVTEEIARTLVDVGGYTHPLFHPAEAADRPVPGQGILLLMGGLVEQSGVLDHAIALVEIRQVRFLSMVRAGSHLRVDVTPGKATPTSSGKLLQELTWTSYDQDGTAVAEATVLMLVRPPEEGES